MARLEDNLVDLETPESVQLTFSVAGPGGRLGAYLLDLVFRFLLLYLVNLLLARVAGVVGGSSRWEVGILLLSFFLVTWGYTTLFEAFWDGRTPGKRILGLRVVKTGGYAIGFYDALLRNLLRAADGLPVLLLGPPFPVYGVGLLVMMTNRRMQRIGDLMAGTMVVRDQRGELRESPDFLDETRAIPRSELRSGYRPSERTLDLIELLHRRRRNLFDRRREEIASLLARPLAERLGYQGADEEEKKKPIEFLERVYKTYQPEGTESLDPRSPDDEGS